MDEEKRKRLEERGWKTGDAKDFLELTPEEEAYIEIKLRLSRGLKRTRKRKGITQVKLAQMMQSSQSRIAKMESGDASVSIDLLIRSYLALGESSKEVGKLLMNSSKGMEKAGITN